MLAVLIIGYFQFLVYFAVFFIVAAVLYLRYKQKRVKLNNSLRILKGLVKSRFGVPLPEEDRECIICWAEYKETDEVVRLSCNAKHFFHTGCIESWIKAGNNTCPMCREAINPNF